MQMEIWLDGKYYQLKPDFMALNQIEEQFSTGIIRIADKLSEGEITLRELVAILRHCTVPQMPERVIQDALIRAGLVYVTQTVADMLALVLAGEAGKTQQPAQMRGELKQMAIQFPD